MGKILITDDHPMVRTGLRALLSGDRHISEIGEAASAEETLQRLTSEQWDLLILDINMPDRSGMDVLREVRPKFSPSGVVTEFAQLLRGFRISRVTGDHYAGEFAREPFRLAGIQYEVSERNKSDIYRDFLPLINSGNVRLLDVPKLVSQLCQLERKTGTAGRDTIDHPKGSAFHDDLANAAAGALLMCSSKPTLIVPSSVVAAGRRFAPPNPWWVT